MKTLWNISILIIFIIVVLSVAEPPASASGNCQIFPPDHIWNTPIHSLPVHPLSDTYINAIGPNDTMHADFGSGVWPPGSTSPIGIPFTTVDSNQPAVPIIYTDYGDESDPGPFPIPPDAPIEGGPDSDGDRHVLVIAEDNCWLYELFYAFPLNNGQSWEAASGANYDLNGYELRPDGWTSADAAGLPIYPGLVRYEEVQSGVIDHAIRFTVENTQNTHVWPARHDAGQANSSYPPMGMYFRLKSEFDITPYPAEVQVILQAMKTYGLILADNGSDWYISGEPHENWDNDMLNSAFHTIEGSNFEAVDVSSLMIDPDSGQTIYGLDFDEFIFLPALFR